jgi:hypothetical protein
MRLAVLADQLWLGIKQIQMRGAAREKQVHHPFDLRLKMRRLGCQRRGLGVTRLSRMGLHQAGQTQAADPQAMLNQPLSASH